MLDLPRQLSCCRLTKSHFWVNDLVGVSDNCFWAVCGFV
jgi:hypothetical protein